MTSLEENMTLLLHVSDICAKYLFMWHKTWYGSSMNWFVWNINKYSQTMKWNVFPHYDWIGISYLWVKYDHGTFQAVNPSVWVGLYPANQVNFLNGINWNSIDYNTLI